MKKLVHILSKNEEKLLEDLIVFNRQYKEVFFSKNRNEEFLMMIDDVILDKLNKLTSFQAFKFLNRIWAKNNEDNTSLDVKIIKCLDYDLAINRLSIQLLDFLSKSTDFYDYYEDCGEKLNDFLYSNFFDLVMINGTRMNYLLMIDNVERFLGLVSSSEDISEAKKLGIINTYMFLYKDIYDEFKRINLSERCGTILSRRADIYKSTRDNNWKFLRVEVTAAQICYMVYEMLSICDDEITDEILEDLKLGKLYLDSLLSPLDSLELEQVLDYYKDYEEEFEGNKSTKALKLINVSINKKRNS